MAVAKARPGVTETRLSRYLAKQIDALAGIKTQREIAHEIGYEKANILSMFKTGEAKVPLDKLPALARALNVDLGLLLRLGIEQYFKDDRDGWAELNRIFERTVTANELEIIQAVREASNDSDPHLDEDRRQAIMVAFAPR